MGMQQIILIFIPCFTGESPENRVESINKCFIYPSNGKNQPRPGIEVTLNGFIPNGAVNLPKHNKMLRLYLYLCRHRLLRQFRNHLIDNLAVSLAL